MKTAAPLQKKGSSAPNTGGGTPVSTPATSQLAALEARANRNPQVQRTAEIGERLNSAPVQRTRDEALAQVQDLYPRDSEYLLQRIRNTNLLDSHRLALIRTNNRGLAEDHEDYIRIDPAWFPDLSPEELEGSTKRETGSKRSTLHRQETVENKRQKTRNDEDSSEEEEEEDLKDAEDYSWEDEARDFEAEEESHRIGVVTWNVAHFSNRDVDSVMGSFVEALREFSPSLWNGFIALLKPFLSFVESRLSPFAGQDEATLKDEAPEIFRRLQTPDAQVQQTLHRVAMIREQLRAFDPAAIADRLREVASHDWRGDLTVARQDLTARLALMDRIKTLKDLEAYSEFASGLFKRIQSLTGSKTLLTRIEQEALRGVFETLLEALAATRERFPAFSLVEDLRRALHSFNVVTHINEMFEDNDWLDAMILQEVNDPTLLEEEGSGFEVFKGPHLRSGGENPQNEYYPLLLREGSEAEVKVYTVDTEGGMEETGHGTPLRWNKKVGDYRPIVVYEIRKGEEGKPVWIGVVHTTPESDQSGGVAEFHRKEIYKEIKLGLGKLRRRAERRGIPLIIGGDFYLTSEAVVEDVQRAKEPERAVGERLEMARSLSRVKKLKSILEYLLAREIREAADPRPQRPRATRREIQAERLRTQGMMARDSTNDAVKILQERIKFLDEAMKDEQVLRNLLGLTAQRQFEDLGLLVAQTVSGTNPKHDPLERWFDVQIADFFLYNKDFRSAAVGILKPAGGMVPVDAEDLRYSRYWQRFSDHFPVGGIFSTDWENLLEHEAFPLPAGSAEDARKMNLRSFAGHGLEEEEDVTNPGVRQTLLDLMEMTRGGEGRMKQLAETYLSERLWELGDPESKSGIDEYVEAIQELEDEENLPPEERLFVVSPTDFEPTEEEV